MILRLTQRLGTKIKAGPLRTLPLDENPWGDWSARLFTADRAQYILVTHTATLYSVVMFGCGITDGGSFIERAMANIREFMEADSLGLVYRNFVAPTSASVRFGKSLNRSVTTSMNGFEFASKVYLARGDVAPFHVGFRLNKIPMTAIATPESGVYSTPRDAIRRLMMT